MTKHSRVFLSLAFIALVVFASPSGISTTGVARQTTETSAKPQSDRVQTVPFQSKLVGATLPYNVLLPVDYNEPAAKSKRYPVLYLLHGLFGHYGNWIEKTNLPDYNSPPPLFFSSLHH